MYCTSPENRRKINWIKLHFQFRPKSNAFASSLDIKKNSISVLQSPTVCSRRHHQRIKRTLQMALQLKSQNSLTSQQTRRCSFDCSNFSRLLVVSANSRKKLNDKLPSLLLFFFELNGSGATNIYRASKVQFTAIKPKRKS